ncbi:MULTISPECIES: septation protein SepH [Mumia]|uniref:septation protein SepH n=1 Tax=Mumia TaxID=1546255 RepID=UPI0014208E35|nr:septation protein SepH [Mumia sp. ZJ430]
MRDLTVVGLSEDQRYVVLRGPVGELFRVPADDRLRATLRNDRARLGQLEIAMDSALRPRDIQARIRRGESPEEVAEAAKLPVERIMGYAHPVLAEREHMAERARGATVRRKHAQSNALTLGESVDTTLRSRGVDPQTADWDSWRRDDARWTVCVRAGAVSADYVFDPAGRYTFAADEAARELVGDVPDASDSSEMAIADAVSRPVDVVELDSDPRVTSLRHARARRAAQASERTEEQPTLNDLPSVTEPEPTLELDEPAEAATMSAPPAAPPEPDAAPRERDGSGDPRPARQSAAASDETDPSDMIDASEDDADADVDGADEQPRKRAPRRRERRRVPSWDEIMFGDKG